MLFHSTLILGTQVLFYEDTTVMREFQDKFKTYEAHFPHCAQPILLLLPRRASADTLFLRV